jgi:sodium-dependent dicarboxylate transporter 2/3/5
MADSRTYAGKFIRKINDKVNWHSHFTLFLLSFLAALGLFYLVSDPQFTETQNYVLFILFFSIALWVTEAIPPFAVGILIIGFLVFSIGNDNPENVKKYVQTWSDSVIWLFLGGFFLAEGMKKTGLDKDLLKVTVPKFGNKSDTILLGLMMLTAVLSMLMSNTATTAMMIATITPILKSLGSNAPLSKNLLIGIPAAASIGGMGTIIGSAPNAIVVGALEGMGIQVSFLEWMLFGIPIALVLILMFWYVLLKKNPIKTKTMQLDYLFNNSIEERTPHKHAKLHKKITLIILVGTLVLWLTSGFTGIPVAVVSGVPIIALTMFSIIESDEVRSLPWDTLMLVAGGLALGLAVQEQGLAQYFVSLIPASEINIYLLYITFGLLTVIFSNIMSNTATATIFIPIAISLTMTIDPSNAITLPMIIGLSASCALLLPVSTPPNAIAFSTGMLKQSDFRLGGVFIGLVGPAVVILWSLLVFSLFY